MFNLYTNMFTIKREKNFQKYFNQRFQLSNYITNSVKDYVDINKIDYLKEMEFCLENNKNYLLIFKHYDDKDLLKIFNPRNNYIILSNKPHNWDYLSKYKTFNGIFMNVSKENIDYETFNQKILTMQKSNMNNVLIIDCCNVDLSKIDKTHYSSVITIFKSIFIPVNPADYDQIILKFGPWVLSELYKNNLFDKKLRNSFSNFMFKENMKGTHNFFLIDNKNILANKSSNLYYVK